MNIRVSRIARKVECVGNELSRILTDPHIPVENIKENSSIENWPLI